MRIAVLGTDERFVRLAELLEGNGYEVVAEAVGAELAVTTWPASADIPEGTAVVTCGPRSGPEGALDLLDDEDYQQEIAWMTAEGAISAAMGGSKTALNGAECMVVGWGRIGKALVQRLVALGAKVTVLSRRLSACGEIYAAGACFAETKYARALMPGMKFVFSTPPHMVLDAEVVGRADGDSVVIDLASPPYGVDVEAAQRLGLKVWREPGLPGRYCPGNAARAIYGALVRHGFIGGENKWRD